MVVAARVACLCLSSAKTSKRFSNKDLKKMSASVGIFFCGVRATCEVCDVRGVRRAMHVRTKCTLGIFTLLWVKVLDMSRYSMGETPRLGPSVEAECLGLARGTLVL